MVYFPKTKTVIDPPTECPGCGKWHVILAGMEHMSCTVFHGAGSCCHFFEREVPEPSKVEQE